MRKSVVSLIVAGVVAAAAVGFVGNAAAQERPVRQAPVAVAVTTPAAPVLPAVDAGDAGLTYEQDGRAVTVNKGATRVATVTLASAEYAARSGEAVLTVEADRAFTVDPAMFTLYDAEGWENDARQTTPVRFDAGAGSLTLTFPRTAGRPMALGWVPQDGEEAAAVWERG